MIQEEGLQENAARVGDHLVNEIKNGNSKWIGDIRGKLKKFEYSNLNVALQAKVL